MTDKDLTNNPYLDLDTDVTEHLSSLTPDTPDLRRVGKQEWLRLALTAAMIAARKQAGMTQKEVAKVLDVSQSWVSKLESANYDHQIESVVSHLDAVGAELLLAVRAGNKLIPVEREEKDIVLVDVPAWYQGDAERQGLGVREYIGAFVEAYRWEDDAATLPQDFVQDDYAQGDYMQHNDMPNDYGDAYQEVA